MTFDQAMMAHGLIPRHVVGDGKWHRCPTEDKPRKKNGAYNLWIDGRRGYFINFATDVEAVEWRDDTPMAPRDRRAMDERIKRLRQQEAAARAQAVRRMREHWESLPILTEWHAYIERKGLSLRGCKGVRLEGDDLVIPMYRGGSLVSLQNITIDGQKLYRKGCSTRGASFVMSRTRSTVTCFVEGFATGLAVFQTVTNASVVVCFDAQNLISVAQDTKVRGMAVVCADNDWETQRDRGINKGVENGRKAAEALGCGIAYPEGITGTDWADALQEWGDRGPAKVRMQIMKGARLVI
ncbi:toprim domain-containing protein [Paraburkholderia strydomiana]|uniref:toprim domain-containing protein n=1 Tax=Paraburkholderia strydomiana TaxID=1245417 RepID=UPI0028638ABD|nr:toprim domain-containing protein [Paraburkholderia strydomiana]MDR7006073.1 putative DNA primase/helicase [Paraburkholderia strydomiana]